MSLNFKIDCPVCRIRNRDEQKNSPVGKMTGEFNDEDYGLGTCTLHADHQQWVFLNNPKYSIFIRNAVDAYIDGYYLESFMKFYQALENFRRLFVESSLFNKDNNLSEILRLSHTSLKNSTFLYGAYKFAYFEFFREIPDTKQSIHSLQINSGLNIVEFRNDVVHNGKEPQKRDLEKIGQIVIHYIQDIEYKFSSKINIAQVAIHPVKWGEKPPTIPFKEGLSPIIPQYSATLLQHEIAQRHKKGDQRKWITANDISSYLTKGTHYPDEANPLVITLNEYVEARKASSRIDEVN